MHIHRLELLTADLKAQEDFYSTILELPAEITESELHIQAGTTELIFAKAPSNFDGAYHFAFNIPNNQYESARKWITRKLSLLHDRSDREDFHSNTWNSDSVYYLDAAGNVLEFIARHTADNAVEGSFDSRQILNVSEIGLPSENVIELADQICTRLGLFPYKQEPSATFTPVGDENGLFILPIQNRIWMPDSGVPAKMLPVKVGVHTNNKNWEVRGVPYEVEG